MTNNFIELHLDVRITVILQILSVNHNSAPVPLPYRDRTVSDGNQPYPTVSDRLTTDLSETIGYITEAGRLRLSARLKRISV